MATGSLRGSVALRSRKFREKFSGNVAVFCSDGRFVEATRELLERIGAASADLLVVPGGPAFIAQGERELLERLELLVKEHHAKRVFLVAHDDCGYYKHRYSSLDASKRREVELEDLKEAVEAVKKYGVAVEAYFARLEGGEVAFERLA